MELARSKVDEPVLICGSDIKVGEVVKLVPSKPTPTGTLYLSNLDIAMVFPMELICFFPPPTSDKPSTKDVVDKMKERVSRFLVPYHFLAGRLQLNPGDGRLELNYNRAGVLFAGASSELTLEQLGDVSSPNPSFRNLFVRTDEFKELSNTPLMTVQVCVLSLDQILDQSVVLQSCPRSVEAIIDHNVKSSCFKPT
jgi:omega-hydroxypalmitate O-feruloyl transferase